MMGAQGCLFAPEANTVAIRAAKRFADVDATTAAAAAEGRGYARAMLGDGAAPGPEANRRLAELARLEVSRRCWLGVRPEVRAAAERLYGTSLAPGRPLSDVEREAVRLVLGGLG